MQTPDLISSRELRRQAIVELIQQRRVRSQEALRTLLLEQGLAVNQATLSRDLRDMGVVKGPQGYELPSTVAAPPNDATAALVQAVRAWLTSATPAQNLLVLKTPPGGATPLALALDGSGRSELLGTVAGDDTVLVVCPDAKTAKQLLRTLQGFGGLAS